MELIITSLISITIVTTVAGVGGFYFLKDDILKIYEKVLIPYFSDSSITRRRYGRASRILPLSNYPVSPKKEIELIEFEPKNYIVIENPNSDISLGVELTKK